MRAESWVGALTLVMRSKDNTMWYKDAGSNFHIPVPCKAVPEPYQGAAIPDVSDDLSRTIIDAEVNTNQWTLMHRCVRS